MLRFITGCYLCFFFVALNAVADPQALEQAASIDSLLEYGAISQEDAAAFRSAAGKSSLVELFGLDRSFFPLPVLAVYRGTEGVEFPAPVFADQFKASPENIAKAQQLFEEKKEEHKRKSLTIKDIPDCREGRTERTEIPHADTLPEEQRDDVMYDRLYIRSSLLPKDFARRYGATVVPRPFEASEGQASHSTLLARNEGVTCLPFRIRATESYVFHHFGSDALKNYDNDPHGAGEVVP